MLLCSPAAVASRLRFLTLVNPARYVHTSRFLNYTSSRSSIQEATSSADALLAVLNTAQADTVVVESVEATGQSQESAPLQWMDKGPYSSNNAPMAISKQPIRDTKKPQHIKKSGTVSSHSAIRKPGSVRVKSKDGKAPVLSPDSKLGRYSHRLLVSYDGTDYKGWQLQDHFPTVQGAMESALSMVTREDRVVLGVCGAGRTDSGVHAAGQVVQFFTNTEPDITKLAHRLNSLLQDDIRVHAAWRTAPDFSVTCTALTKTYHYHIHTARIHNPFTLRYRHHQRQALDVTSMRLAASCMVGIHDFTQFSNQNDQRLKRNPVKLLQRVDVLDAEDGLRVEVQGTGFLYKMVRHLTGVLIAVGEGALPVGVVPERLKIGNSTVPGGLGGLWRGYNIAPAKGLILHKVTYPDDVDDPSVILYPTQPHDSYGRLIGHLPGRPVEGDDDE